MLRCRCMECEIERLTFSVRMYREYLRLEEELGMALKLDGLKRKSTLARQTIEDLGKAYDEFNHAGAEHHADIKSLHDDLGEMQDDLGFATRTLGNSVAGSNAGAA